MPSGKRDRLTTEPLNFQRGKRFHKLVQADWLASAGGKILSEHGIPLAHVLQKQRHGRIDIFVDELGDYVTVVEIKATSWDRIKPANIQRNLAAHRRQVWRYVEKYLEVDRVACCPGVIYPRAPKTPGLKERIESYLNSYGLQVVWYHDKKPR